MSWCELLKITSDTAVDDYYERGMSSSILKEHNYAILVSRLALRIHFMPKENQKITVTTWEEKPEALQLRRAYEITSENGENLVSGLTTWLIVDPEAHRIMPAKNFTMREAPDFETEHNCMKPGKILVPKDMELWDERIIKYSDLDGNDHTNNARYGAFFDDAIPEKYRSLNFTDLRLNYAKEAKLGQKLSIYGVADEEAKKLTFVGRTPQEISFEAELYYQNNTGC